MSITASPAVYTSGLKKVFGQITAVDSISLSVLPGEIFGLVGPDGAGKTTTIRMLCGIMAPTAGEITVGGYNVLTQPEEAKRRIGYMSQRFSIYGDLTVQENIAFFSDIYHVPKSERAEREAELLEFSRLAPFKDRLAQNLSGGMRQKLALTCTLMHKPDVFFLDEPTTGVDPVSRRDFWKILYTLVSDGTTLVVSTPYMDEAERCGRIALIDKGSIIDCDTPDNLRDRMRGELIEVICTPQRRAKDLISGIEGVISVQTFGDRLHVWVMDGIGIRRKIEETLRQSGIRIEHLRIIEPSLEDIFVSVMSGREEQVT